MAHFAHLGESFLSLPEFCRSFAGACSCDRAIDELQRCFKGAWTHRLEHRSRSTPKWVWGQTQRWRIIFMGMGIAAAIETAAAAASASAPPPHRRTAAALLGALVWGPFFALCGGRFLGSVCLFFGLSCSFSVRLPRTVDGASNGLGFGRLRVRLSLPICVIL